jgi:hypothetical protein
MCEEYWLFKGPSSEIRIIGRNNVSVQMNRIHREVRRNRVKKQWSIKGSFFQGQTEWGKRSWREEQYSYSSTLKT